MIKRYLSGLIAAAAFACAGSLGWFAAAGAAFAAESGYQPQSSMAQGVMVEVTPPDFAPAASVWDFVVSLQTHTHELHEDLAQSARLVAGGKQYAPLAWEGTPPGGHHRKGVLRFKAVMPRPQSVELQIPLSGESAPRSFKWQLR